MYECMCVYVCVSGIFLVSKNNSHWEFPTSVLERPRGFQVDTTSLPSLKFSPNFPYKHHVLEDSWQLTLEAA